MIVQRQHKFTLLFSRRCSFRGFFCYGILFKAGHGDLTIGTRRVSCLGVEDPRGYRQLHASFDNVAMSGLTTLSAQNPKTLSSRANQALSCQKPFP